MATEIHKNDVGTIFRVTMKDGDTAVDISTATTKRLIFTKPDGVKVNKNTSFYTDGVDGIMQYTTTASGDLDVCGNWRIQGYVALPSGSWHTDIVSFKVHDNL